MEIELIYMNARYYVPAIGRFASADTIVQDHTDPQSLNRYAYARNNPLKYTDPIGHYIFQEEPGTETHWVPGSKPLITCARWDCDRPPSGEVTVGDLLAPVAALYGPATAYGVAPAIPTAGYSLFTNVWARAGAVIQTLGSLLCGDGDCTNEVQSTSTSVQSVWKLPTFLRGIKIEMMLVV